LLESGANPIIKNLNGEKALDLAQEADIKLVLRGSEMAVNGQVVIKPMMYLALSYDHRIIDGRESVSFLVRVKELLENPALLLFGKDPLKSLLEI